MSKTDKLRKLMRPDEYVGDILFLTALGHLTSGNNDYVALIFTCLGSLMLGAFSFVFNDIEDAEDDLIDSEKRKRNLFSANEIDIRKGYLLCAMLVLIGLFLYAQVSIEVFAIGFLGFILVFFYSYRRVRLKAVPVLDLVVHGLGHTIVFLLPTLSLDLDKRQILIASIVFIVSLLGNVKNQIRDYDTDRANKLSNTAGVLNLHRHSYLLNFPTIGLLLFMTFLTITYLTMVDVFIALFFVLGVTVVYLFQWGSKHNPYDYPHENTVAVLSAGLLLFFSI